MAPAKAAAKRPVPTFDHLRKKQPLERIVRIALNDEVATAYHEASEAAGKAELALKAVEAQAQRRNGSAGPDTERAVAAARAEFEEFKAAAEKAHKALAAETVEVRFRALGRKAYDELVRAHPPKDVAGEDGKVKKSTDPYEYETFAPALVAACCVEPEMTVEQVQTLFEEWNAAEVMELWVAALSVNTQRRVVEFGNFSNGTRG
ncbi:MAG TPA: hypothetical protein VEG38_18940 [Acidimicrobiia bacterium]|nr:hypothetical protein [Acidimicrobiia bacterium]